MEKSTIYRERIAALRSQMEKQGISVLFLTPSSDLLYTTGYAKGPTDRPAALALTQSRSYFLCPVLEKKDLKNISPDLAEPIFYSDEEDPFIRLKSLRLLSQPLKQTAAIGGMAKSAFLLRLMELFPDACWKNADCLLSPLRSVKVPCEIRIIREAQSKAERALSRLLASGLEGKTCRMLSRELMELRLDEGFDSVGAGLIACGPESASPHPQLTDRIIRNGDSVMFDIGGTYKGYHADMTRTFAVGRASSEFREAYEIVLQAHLAARQMAREGVPACRMDEAARDVITAAGYGAYFTHRLGHGIGLDIHEPPYADAKAALPLMAGNVLSDEPGIYLPGKFGIRIEDLLVITKDGCQTLNSMPKSLCIV